MRQKVIQDLRNETATRRLGAKLSALFVPGDVIALYGGLGAGKTTLSRGIIQALCGPDEEVPSPTYTLVQTYETPIGLLWHFDLYRLNTPGELIELGWDETYTGISLIEWPENAGEALPSHRLDISLSLNGAARTAHLEAHGKPWQKRLNDTDL